MKLSSVPRGTRQSVLLFGPPKVGKTQLVGELTKHGFKLFYVGLENGHATLQKLSPEQQDQVEMLILPDSRSFPIAIETCLKIVKGDALDVCDEHGKVSCATCKKEGKSFTSVHFNALDSKTVVVFDSITQLVASAIAHITRGKPDDYKLDYDDWGNLGKLMEIFFSHIQTAKYNVVCISHEMGVKLEDGKEKLVPVGGTSNFSRNTAKYFGHCVYAQVSNAKHKFISSTTGTLNIVSGSRTDIVMEKMNEPSLAGIFESGSGNGQSRDDKSGVTNGVPKSDSEIDSTLLSNTTPGETAATNLTGLQAKLAAARTAGAKNV